jgi:hypothetical protein
MFYQVWRRPIADPNGWVLRGSMTGPAFVDRVEITNSSEPTIGIKTTPTARSSL